MGEEEEEEEEEGQQWTRRAAQMRRKARKEGSAAKTRRKRSSGWRMVRGRVQSLRFKVEYVLRSISINQFILILRNLI
jgi:hypothetical protein